MAQEYPQQFGPYELLRPLGRGGMAEVFLAHARTNRGEKRLVALKRMHAGLSEDSGAVEMLVAEAKLAMRFDHPNIATTFELGSHGGAYYFIMEYVNGIDLGTLASVSEALGERLDPVLVARICLGIGRGLHHAHTLQDDDGTPLGVVHRDVSPQNVLIDRRGRVKLIDFGVAKVATRIQQTMAGIIKGKYAYMSPEQASAEKVDARSDVFSLGICMHELLSGRPLFRGPHMVSPFAILRAVREDPVPLVHEIASGVDPRLSAMVDRALQRQISARYPSAGALADDIDAWLQEVAPDFDEARLQAAVQALVQRAPTGAMPERSVATPPLASMMGHEFAPSPLSVVARSPLEEMAEADTDRPALSRPPHRGSPAAPALRPRSTSTGRAAAAPAAAVLSPQRPPSPLHTGIAAHRPPPRRSLRPSRKAVLQFLWVGLAAFIFAFGWSVIATLKRFGVI